MVFINLRGQEVSVLLKQGWISSLSCYLASHSREGASMASLLEGTPPHLCLEAEPQWPGG